METLPTCKNCQAELHGDWCSQCGQKVMDKRWTVKRAISEFFSAITNVERGFLFTIKEMAVRPGVVVSDFINGKTKPYFPPFRFAFILVTISAVILVWSGIFDQQQDVFSSMADPDQSESQVKMKEMINQGTKKFLNLLVILVLPFYALSTFLLLRKRGFTYAEHFIASTYLVGQTSLYGLVLLPIYVFYPELSVMSMGASVLVTALVIMQMIHGWIQIPLGESFAYGVIASILGQVLMIVTMMLVGIVFAILWILGSKALGGEVPQIILPPQFFI